MTDPNPPRPRGSATHTLFYGLAILVMAVWGLTMAADLLIPIAIAVLIWFLINATSHSLRHIPWLGPRLTMVWSLTLSSIIVTAVTAIAINLVINSIAGFGENLQQSGRRLNELMGQIQSLLPFGERLHLERALEGVDLQAWVTTVGEALGTILGQAGTILLYVIFLLLDQPLLPAKLRALFPEPQRRAEMIDLIDQIASDVGVYLGLMTFVSVLVGILTWATLLAYGVNGAAFWAFVAFALNIVCPRSASLSALACRRSMRSCSWG